jgi:hypothetical protein
MLYLLLVGRKKRKKKRKMARGLFSRVDTSCWQGGMGFS